jgi:hypothetical protein
MTLYTIRKTFAIRGIYPYNPKLVIEPLVAAQTPEPDLKIFDGTPPPEQISSIPNIPPKSVWEVRRTYNKMVNILNKSPLPADIRYQLLRVAQSQI